MIKVKYVNEGYCNACRSNKVPAAEVLFTVEGAGGGMSVQLCTACQKELKEKLSGAMPKVLAGFAPGDEAKVVGGLQAVLQAIGPDLFAEVKSMPRSHVVEVCLDASYLESHGRVAPEILKRFRALSYERQKAVARKAFLSARYS